MLTSKDVVAYKQRTARYSNNPPFHSPETYPEYTFGAQCDSSNEVYRSIRDSFRLLGLDREHFGKPNWSPLKDCINPGETVLLKPNLIADSHLYNDEWEHVITHGSVIRTLVDYVYLALQGRGKVIIADAPQPDSRMDLIKQRIAIESIQELYWRHVKFAIDFIDLRDEHWIEKDGIWTNKVTLQGDPKGNVRVNLRNDSFFAEQDNSNKRYYGAFYDVDETNRHHTNGIHEYMISRTALESDVFISLPKMKTHKKVGITLNLKGLVGINGNKNWLPHYAIGSPEENGDQFPSRTMQRRLENTLVLKAKHFLAKGNPIMQLAAKRFKKLGYCMLGDTEEVVRSGNWYGNDTCWRMTLDLNRILFYANSDGTFRDKPKRYLSVVDGIIGMEGNGPTGGMKKASGMIVVGFNPLATDMVCAKLMGFDYKSIAMLHRAFDQSPHPFVSFSSDDIYVKSNENELEGYIADIRDDFLGRFEPHFAWKGHVEL